MSFGAQVRPQARVRARGPRTMMRRMKSTLRTVLCLTLLAAAPGDAQDQAPRNDLPAALQDAPRLGQLPPGVPWAAVTAIEPAPDGTLYVIHRCFANSCAGPQRGADLKYDAQRQAARSWGEGDVHLPARRHRRSRRQPLGDRCARRGRQGTPGLQVQPRRQGADDARQGRRQRRRTRSLRSTDRRRRRAGRRHLRHRQPPQRQEQPRRAASRRTGKFVKEWGTKGSGPGEFSEPHTIAMDSRGRLFVGDRENNRIQIFDQDGTSLDEWRQFGRPSGIAITRDDTIYVADSESGPDTGAHELPGIKKGIRIGSAQGRLGHRVHRGHGIDGAGPFGRGRRRRRCAGQRLRRCRPPPDARTA